MSLPRPVDAVWLAFRDPAIVRRWHGWQFDGLDEEIASIYTEHAVVDQKAGTLHLGGHLFTLTPQGAQTHLHVTRKPPVTTAGDDIDWDRQYADIEEGWISFLQQFRFMLARHLQHTRRTFFRAGSARSAMVVPCGDLLGLSDASATPAGEPYLTDLGPGDHAEGEVWFRTGLQLGVTVDAWGDGLLIVTHSPSAAEPFADASVILTTYGLDDDAFADLERRWATWWQARYEE